MMKQQHRSRKSTEQIDRFQPAEQPPAEQARTAPGPAVPRSNGRGTVADLGAAPESVAATAAWDGVVTIGEDVERGRRPLAAYTRLRDLIVGGALAPGGPLVETDIADRLGVSRTPVRAALERLHQEGLVVGAARPRLFKFVVAPLTREDAESLFHIMAELEGLAAHDAAGRPAADRQRLVRTLGAVNDALRALAGARDPDSHRFHQLDRAFHRHYVEAGATPRLLAFHDAVEPQVERYWRVYAVLRSDAIGASAGEHDEIVRALAGGDADAAQRAARLNWRNSADRLVPAIERIGARGSW